ncbi:hypothetical protein C463_10625 [Halorubrum californiense DSM 19288]|uniref:DUF7982 domain-containing protein n=1 Tax=Halorubrum californiense DSM 19288 TaxID=1227465 RepID=M0E6G0_9EURY|nr:MULTISPECIES: hypothetical protein [Halorubrum]ELZ42643.1 hypothetical protein C463_10625 [Halorubrum californiense DSM 19288]
MDDTGDTEATRAGQAVETDPTTDASESADLQTRVAVLEAENRQLRDERARAKRATYRQTALGLFAVGALGLLGGVAFPDARSVLFALGGTGVFAGVLTYVLTPERFVTASVGSRVYQAVRADRDAMLGELGIGGDPVYVPVDDGRVFVSRHEGAPLPDPAELADLFVVPEESQHGGVAFHPTGAPLFDEFETTRSRSVDATPHAAAPVLADALVELFELADGVDHDVDTETNRITFELAGAGLGDPTGIDHPIPSFLAVGLARSLDVTVRLEVRDDPLTVTCRYDPNWSRSSDGTAATDTPPERGDEASAPA